MEQMAPTTSTAPLDAPDAAMATTTAAAATEATAPAASDAADASDTAHARPPPPPPGSATPRLFAYAFTLADPPHPSPESLYAPCTPSSAEAPYNDPHDGKSALQVLLLRRQQRMMAAAAAAAMGVGDAGGPSSSGPRGRAAPLLLPYDPLRQPRLLPLPQRYLPHGHSSGNPCTNCGIMQTSTWRRLNPTRELCCNSCSDYFRRRARYRPIAGLPARRMGVDLVAEGDTWPAMVARAAAAAAAAGEAGGAGGGGGT